MDSAGGRGFGAGKSEVGAIDRCEIVAVIASEASERAKRRRAQDCANELELRSRSRACHIAPPNLVPETLVDNVAEGLVDEDHCSLGLSLSQDEVATGASYVNYSEMWWDGKRWYWWQQNRGHC